MNQTQNQIHKLPEGWQIKKLCEISEIIMGQSPPSNTYNVNSEGLPFFQGKAEFGERFPKVVKWCNKPVKIAEAGDILMSVRAPVGPVNIANQKCCIGRGLCAIRAKKEIDNLFIYYFLKLKEKELLESGSGSTFNAISKKEVEKIDIPICSLSEQKKIVNKLEEINNLVNKVSEEQKKIDSQLAVLPKAVLSKAFKGELVK